MPDVEQFYYTHCTRATAAFVRDASGGRDEVHGYAFRAASFPAHRADEMERAVGGILYVLPRDTPWSQCAKLTAQEAPRRLTFYPARPGQTEAYHVLGQVCYRNTDTTEARRRGSYFAHFALAQAEQFANWTAVDALRLWDASGWCLQDSPDIGYVLDPLESFEELSGRKPRKEGGPHEEAVPSVSDDVLLGFLRTQAGGDFPDPGNVIPGPYRHADPEIRQGLLVDLIRGFLELDRADGQSLLLVTPPGFAALLFYGILRLVPRTARGDDVSFSTYETDCTQVPATLVATTFYDVANMDLSAEEKDPAGFALNAFRYIRIKEDPQADRRFRIVLGERPKFRHGYDVYPSYVVTETLADRGWEETDRLLELLEEVEARHAETLERLSKYDRICASYNPQLEDEEAVQYARRFYSRQFQRGKPSREGLKRLAGSRRIGSILAKIPAFREGETGGQLLDLLSPEVWAELVQHDELSTQYRAFLLDGYVRRWKGLPFNLESRLTNHLTNCEILAQTASCVGKRLRLPGGLPASILSNSQGCTRLVPARVAQLANEVAKCKEFPPERVAQLLDGFARCGGLGCHCPRLLEGRTNDVLSEDSQTVLRNCLLQASPKTLGQIYSWMHTDRGKTAIVSELVQLCAAHVPQQGTSEPVSARGGGQTDPYRRLQLGLGFALAKCDPVQVFAYGNRFGPELPRHTPRNSRVWQVYRRLLDELPEASTTEKFWVSMEQLSRLSEAFTDEQRSRFRPWSDLYQGILALFLAGTKALRPRARKRTVKTMDRIVEAFRACFRLDAVSEWKRLKYAVRSRERLLSILDLAVKRNGPLLKELREALLHKLVEADIKVEINDLKSDYRHFKRGRFGTGTALFFRRPANLAESIAVSVTIVGYPMLVGSKPHRIDIDLLPPRKKHRWQLSRTKYFKPVELRKRERQYRAGFDRVEYFFRFRSHYWPEEIETKRIEFPWDQYKYENLTVYIDRVDGLGHRQDSEGFLGGVLNELKRKW